MNKFITSIGLAAIAAVLTVSCSKSNSGEFVLGLDDAFPPMGFRDNADQIVGFDIDLAKAVCDKLGMKFCARPIDWDSKELELNSGNITCIWNGFTMTDERRAKMCCTPAYLKNAQVAVVRKGSGIAGLADLAGKSVCTQTGSSGEECINANEEFKKSLGDLVLVGDYLNAFMQLESGAVDAIVMDSVVAEYQVKLSGKDFEILSEELSPEEYGIAFKLGNDALRDAVWDTLKELAREGKVAEISTKWFGSDLTTIK